MMNIHKVLYGIIHQTHPLFTLKKLFIYLNYDENLLFYNKLLNSLFIFFFLMLLHLDKLKFKQVIYFS